MTHKFKKEGAVYCNPGTMSKRPELAALIGTICSEWVYVEATLLNFFGIMMKVCPPDTPKEDFPQMHPVAMHIFDKIHTVHARIEVFKNIVQDVIKDDGFKKEVLGVLEKTKKTAKSRNEVAHALWGISDKEPDALIMVTIYHKFFVYKENDFENIIQKIQTVGTQLIRVQGRFCTILQSTERENFLSI